MNTSCDLSIVIVNYNTKDLLLDCLASIQEQAGGLSVEVFVVDNASRDGSADEVRRRFPRVQVIDQRENVGFSAANNIAIPLSRGRFVLLLNPDTVILEHALERMVGYLTSHQAVGVVGPKTFDATRLPVRFANWRLTPLRYLVQPALVRMFGNIGDKDVDWVCGACLMIRREVIDRIGLLDTYMFGEDMDWCLRAKRAGWRVHHLASAHIIHYCGASAAAPELSPGRLFVTRQAKAYYIRKHNGPLSAFLFSAVLMFESIVKILILECNSRLGGRPSTRTIGKIQGYKRLMKAILADRLLQEDQKWWTYRVGENL